MSEKPTYEELAQRIQELEKSANDRAGSEKQLKLISLAVDQSRENLAVIDMDGNLAYLNTAFAEIHGYSIEKLVGKNISVCHTPEQMSQVETANTETEKKGSFKGEIWHAKWDGTVFPAWVHNSLMRDDAGKPIGLITTLRDISDVKKTAELLKEREIKHRALIKNLPGMVYRAKPDWSAEIISGSDKISGYTADELNSKKLNWLSIIHPDDTERIFKEGSVLATQSKELVQTYRIVTKGGNIRWVEDRKTSLVTAEGEFVGIDGVIFDITNRKQATQLLRESEEKYRSIYENAVEGFFQSTPEGRFISVNSAFARILGYTSPEELIATITDIATQYYVYPEDRAHYKRRLLKAGYVEDFKFRARRKDGSQIWVSGSTREIYDQSGAVVRYEGNVRDISNRKRAEEALHKSEEKFRTLVEQSPLGISLIGKDGHYKYVNPRFEELFGYTINDCPTGKEWFRQAYPDDAYRQKALKSWIKDLEQIGNGQARPNVYTVTCKDGARKEIHFMPVTLEDRSQFILYEDVSERARMERQLQQTQKFEALGTLSGGIAHDFNNLLMGIQGRASLMAAELEPFHPFLEHTNAIEGYIRSATDLTRQLLGLARGGKYEVRPTDTNELVRNSANMFGRTKKEIRIHTNFQDPPPVVAVDRSQIEQVLLNLYINAWQAMPGGGELYLETQIATLDDAYCKPYHAKPGQYAKVSVTDTGIGMDANTRQQIFDPFFTTKEKGRGTGLGLASAYGIIKNHDGIIIVYSEVGHGTTFNLYLPLSGKEAYREVAIEGRLIEGSGTILLVDDEEMILEVGRAMLERLGYRIIVAVGGEAAVKVVERKGNEIDLVILDLIMPGMDGGEVFNRIKEVLPQMQVLLSSGYAINGQADEIMQKGCNGFIQKPFNISELSRKVRKILDGH